MNGTYLAIEPVATVARPDTVRIGLVLSAQPPRLCVSAVHLLQGCKMNWQRRRDAEVAQRSDPWAGTGPV